MRSNQGETSDILSQRPDLIKEILDMLKDKCESSPISPISSLICISAATIVVAALKILTAVTDRGQFPINSRKSVCSDISCSVNIPKDTLSDVRRIELVRMLKRLIKRRDSFVAPAAVAALCGICNNGSSTLPIPVIRADPLPNIEQLHAEAVLRSNILVTLIKLFESDKQGLSGGPRGLMELAESGSYLTPSKAALLTR